MQFQVPQFIETEDKIIGPLTLKQFLYLGVAGALIFMLYFLVTTWLWFILAALVAGVGASLAFAKVEGRAMPAVVVAALRFFWQPQQYVWQQKRTAEPKKEPGAEAGPSPLEKIVTGFALKSAWRTVQTGSKAPEEPKPAKTGTERYEVFRGLTGEKRAARRVDYR